MHVESRQEAPEPRTLPPDERFRPSGVDLHLFNEGTWIRAWEKLGSHLCTHDGMAGASFAVWAPNAELVGVIGDFNDWRHEAHPLVPIGVSGLWHGFVPGARRGQRYKYHVRSRHHGYRVDKADPFAVRAESPSGTASVLWELDHEWHDEEWMRSRKERNALDAPIAIYELHPGSWMRVPEEGDRFLTYRELAPRLGEHLKKIGFTHVELMPVMEHPFYGSWGYQTTGYFAPTSRYGTPQDLMAFIDHLHRQGIAVILDWVPGHFPTDEHGLGYFDGTHLYEHADPRQGLHPEWNSFIFNLGRNEVRGFLLASAHHWLERYHVDGLRVDAVTSMLYLDYSRKEGEWIPNELGGRENLHAIAFLRRLNEEVYRSFPGVQTFAEESTSWPMVSRPASSGGLGFGFKWDMGWMHDTLRYVAVDPLHRKHHQDDLTFRMMYGFDENFVLALSHDEVVHGKRSLLEKMPGDDWQKAANLRLLYAYQYAMPGKKLLFMGDEFGQRSEWSHERSLDWHLLEQSLHSGCLTWVGHLNRVYRDEAALHESDHDPEGFRWVNCSDRERSVVSLVRKNARRDQHVLIVCNFTPLPRANYRLGAPRGGIWREILNSDAKEFGGSGHGNLGAVEASPVPLHGRTHSLTLTLPPLGALFLKSEGERP
jgi:1,4-alpha-glucan branching enzyme